jgi:small subunit ribosomal protein S20
LYRGAARTFVRRARTVIVEGDTAAARQATLEAISVLDKAASKGVIHKNNAARRKSRLMRRLVELENKA